MTNHLRSLATQVLKAGRPQMTIIDDQDDEGAPRLQDLTGRVSRGRTGAIAASFGKRQICFGCQNFRNTTRHSIDAAEDRTAGEFRPHVAADEEAGNRIADTGHQGRRQYPGKIRQPRQDDDHENRNDQGQDGHVDADGARYVQGCHAGDGSHHDGRHAHRPDREPAACCRPGRSGPPAWRGNPGP